MDVVSFLKTVPAVIGIAGLLTFFMRARSPVSDHELVSIVQGVRNTFLLLGCAALIMLSTWLILRPAPLDHDATILPGKHTLLARRGSLDNYAAAVQDGRLGI